MSQKIGIAIVVVGLCAGARAPRAANGKPVKLGEKSMKPGENRKTESNEIPLGELIRIYRLNDRNFVYDNHVDEWGKALKVERVHPKSESSTNP